MADIVSVVQALQDFIVSTFYSVLPPVAGQSVIGSDVEVGDGDPDEIELKDALLAGHVFIAIIPTGGERDTTRFEEIEEEVARLPPGMSAVISGQTITFAGVANAGDCVGVNIGGVNYTFELMLNETATQLANAVVAAIVNTTVVGAVVSFNNIPLVFISTNGQSVKNVGNTERLVQFTLWAQDQQTRDKAGSLLEANIRDNPFIYTGAAQEAIRMKYASSMYNNKPQDAGGYMRVIRVTLDYPATKYTPAYAVLFPTVATQVIPDTGFPIPAPAITSP